MFPAFLTSSPNSSSRARMTCIGRGGVAYPIGPAWLGGRSENSGGPRNNTMINLITEWRKNTATINVSRISITRNSSPMRELVSVNARYIARTRESTRPAILVLINFLRVYESFMACLKGNLPDPSVHDRRYPPLVLHTEAPDDIEEAPLELGRLPDRLDALDRVDGRLGVSDPDRSLFRCRPGKNNLRGRPPLSSPEAYWFLKGRNPKRRGASAIGGCASGAWIGDRLPKMRRFARRDLLGAGVPVVAGVGSSILVSSPRW